MLNSLTSTIAIIVRTAPPPTPTPKFFLVTTQNLWLFRIPSHDSENKKCAVQRVARHCDGNTIADNGHLISKTDTTEPL